MGRRHREWPSRRLDVAATRRLDVADQPSSLVISLIVALPPACASLVSGRALLCIDNLRGSVLTGRDCLERHVLVTVGRMTPPGESD